MLRPGPMRTRALAPLLVAAVPAAVAIAMFWRTLDNGFIWDDPIVIKRQLITFRSLRDVFLPPADIPEFSPNYYRPLVILSYKIDQFLWGADARGFHLSVVLVQALCSALVGVLGLVLLPPARASPACCRESFKRYACCARLLRQAAPATPKPKRFCDRDRG